MEREHILKEHFHPMDIASNTTLEKPVLVIASTPMSVGNVQGPTLLASAGGQLQQPKSHNKKLPHNQLPTPVNPTLLRDHLSGINTTELTFLIEGFSKGFHIPFHGQITFHEPSNLKSARIHHAVIEQKIEKELHLGRIAGPFTEKPLPNFIVSPIGVVPKKEPDTYRMIHHLSHPHGFSVNDGISEMYTKVTYATVDDAIAILRQLQPGAFLSKTDIQSAFRIMPMHPTCYHLLGFKFNDLYYYDKCLPMGLSASCQLFERLSTALEWYAKHKLGIQHVIHILDDFLFIHQHQNQCADALSQFVTSCENIGIPIAYSKTYGPSTVLPFAGIELDSVKQEARLPQDKLIKCRTLVQDVMSRKKVTLLYLQQLLGLLNYACIVVPPGRPFLRRLIDLTLGVRHQWHWIRLTKEARKDLQAWSIFLESFNGSSFFNDNDWITNCRLHLYTDASKTVGYGAVFGTSWFYGIWPKAWLSLDILVKELYPIVAAVTTWGDRLANKKLIFHTDNEALVYILQKCTCKEPQTMSLVRKLVLTCMKYNIIFHPKHIPGKYNQMADMLSRSKLQEFFTAAPQMDPLATMLTPEILPDNWHP